MTEFKLEYFDTDIASMYPLTEYQKEQFIRSWIVRQINAATYEKCCYQNKINYIVWRLGL